MPRGAVRRDVVKAELVFRASKVLSIGSERDGTAGYGGGDSDPDYSARHV